MGGYTRKEKLPHIIQSSHILCEAPTHYTKLPHIIQSSHTLLNKAPTHYTKPPTHYTKLADLIQTHHPFHKTTAPYTNYHLLYKASTPIIQSSHTLYKTTAHDTKLLQNTIYMNLFIFLNSYNPMRAPLLSAFSRRTNRVGQLPLWKWRCHHHPTEAEPPTTPQSIMVTFFCGLPY